MDWTSGSHPALRTSRLDDHWDVWLDPECVFWALVGRNAEGARAEAETLHGRVASDRAARFRRFRFETHVTALYVNPSDVCNTDCRYCYIPPEVRRSGRRMDRAALTVVLEKAREYFSRQELSGRKPVVIFHGGEPLGVKDLVFWAIQEYRQQFTFGLQTNGVLLDDEDVRFLKEARVSVGISLDSHNPRTHAALRGIPGDLRSFQRTTQAIERFNDYPGLNVVTTITRYNVADLPELVGFLHERKVGAVLMNPVRLTQPYARDLKPDDGVLLQAFSRAVRRASDLSHESGRQIVIGNFSNLVLAIVAPEGRRLMCDITPCGGGRCFLAVTANGDLIPCGEFQGLRGFSGANIFRDRIEDALDSAPFQRVRGRTVEGIEACRECPLRHICGAPCPAEAQGACGHLSRPSPYCEFYKGIIRLAFQMIADGQVRYLLRDAALQDLQFEYCRVW